MRNVVITSRTRMAQQRICVGCLDVENHESLRLLLPNGDNPPSNAPYQIGQVWQVDGYKPEAIKPPHVEDFCVTSQRLLETISSEALKEFITTKLPIWRGGVETLYSGLVRFTSNGSGYISEAFGVPDRSTWFWQPDAALHLDDDQRHYRYVRSNRVLRIAYVGFAAPIPEIPQGTLTRLSLARWWTGNGSHEPRCYLQFSGWY